LTRAQASALAAVVALSIIAAGTTYAFLRPGEYQSTAVLALAPRANVATEDIPALVGGFGNSGTAGTYVELITSADTLRAAGSPPVTVTARAVPDSRVIVVTTTGDQSQVRDGLTAVLRAATLAQQRLRDAWELRLVQRAQAPVASGPSRAAIVAGSLVLAAFGVVLLFVVLRHLRVLDERERVR
jgi:uncharacterized protein involved in exopolysaccharide biosynthesis